MTTGKTHGSVCRSTGVQHHTALVLFHVLEDHILADLAAFNNLIPTRQYGLVLELAIQNIIGLGRKLGRCGQHKRTTLIEDISQLSGWEGRR